MAVASAVSRSSTRLAASVRTVPWVAKELAAGHIRDRRLLRTLVVLKTLSAGGYYHNIQLTDRYSTYSIGGMRSNRPLNDPSYSEVLWDCIANRLGNLSGLQVVDIGPAEGFFTLAAARAGAVVTAIHPEHYLFNRRLRALADFFGLDPRIQLLLGYYPAVGGDAVRRADVVLCLGLLYHLDNLVEGMAPMVASRATLVIEGMMVFGQDREAVVGFDPVGHRMNEPICGWWLANHLTHHGFQVHWLKSWERFVERPGNLRHAGTRRALIAVPQEGTACTERGQP